MTDGSEVMNWKKVVPGRKL